MSIIEKLLGVLLVLTVIFVPIAGWFTHLWICFTTASWGFLIAGAIFFPIGVIHGIGHWFGAW